MIKIQKEFRKFADSEVAKKSTRFFKTEVGEYGHGDKFLGIRSPVIRKLAKDNVDTSFKLLNHLISSKYHEERLYGLIILVNKYKKSKFEDEKIFIYNYYLSQFKFINNWDLVDVTCPHIIGKHLMDKDRSILYEWAISDNLWIRRISMITNWWFVRNNDLKEVFKLAKILLSDEEDLIHKAVGWMLREAGKKDIELTKKFLSKHYEVMPRTMLRYAIEKFPEKERKAYLNGLI